MMEGNLLYELEVASSRSMTTSYFPQCFLLILYWTKKKKGKREKREGEREKRRAGQGGLSTWMAEPVETTMMTMAIRAREGPAIGD